MNLPHAMFSLGYEIHLLEVIITWSFVSSRVMRALKEYAVEAIVNAVDHLGSVSYKVNNLLDEEVDEVFLAESEISCVEQVWVFIIFVPHAHW